MAKKVKVNKTEKITTVNYKIILDIKVFKTINNTTYLH